MTKRRVLVLDDDATARESLARFLGARGYETIEVGTASEAIDLIRRTRIGAVILDVRLPDSESGLDVLEHLRSHPTCATIPAIILTGAVLTEDEHLTVARHHAHLFHKPENLDSIIEVLAQLTGYDQSR